MKEIYEADESIKAREHSIIVNISDMTSKITNQVNKLGQSSF